MKDDPIHLLKAYDFKDATTFYDCDTVPGNPNAFFCYLVDPSTHDCIHYAYMKHGNWTHHNIMVKDAERNNGYLCEMLLKDHREQYPNEETVEEMVKILEETEWMPPVSTLQDAIDSYEPNPGTTCLLEDEGRTYEDWIAFVNNDGRWVKALMGSSSAMDAKPVKQVTLKAGDDF